MSTKNKPKKTQTISGTDIDFVITDDIVTSGEPRAMMKNVRRLVNVALKQGLRVDKLNFTGGDVARSQIALQDRFDQVKGKHERATRTIAELRSALVFMNDAAVEVVEDCEDRLVETQAVGEAYSKEVSDARSDVEKYHNLYRDADHDHMMTKQKLDAALTTIKTLMEGV